MSPLPTPILIGIEHGWVPTSAQLLKNGVAGGGSGARQIKNNKIHNKMSLSVPHNISLIIFSVIYTLSPYWGPEEPSSIQSILCVSFSVCLTVCMSVCMYVYLSLYMVVRFAFLQ